jgi:hypothetical protein
VLLERDPDLLLHLLLCRRAPSLSRLVDQPLTKHADKPLERPRTWWAILVSATSASHIDLKIPGTA